MQQSPSAPPDDRLSAVALAGADLLVEASTDGTIRFATGAFRQRMGIAPEEAVGRHLRSLVAASDHTGLDLALDGLLALGRLQPMMIRLSDTARTQATFAAIVVPSTPPRICVTLGPVPNTPDSEAEEPTDLRTLAREAEARLRDGAARELALVEVGNWRQIRAHLSGDDQRVLRACLAETVCAAGADGTAQDFGDGRFVVLMADSGGVAALAARLGALVRESPAAQMARVDGIGLSPGSPALAPSQAVLALRYMLSKFRSGGVAAAREAAATGSLAGVLAHVAGRAATMRQAILARKFGLHYQPVVSLVDRSTHHFEALLRPFSQSSGPEPTPQEFVVAVEAMGLTEELDCAVTETALAALRAEPDIAIAVNISGLSMQSEAFHRRLMALLTDPTQAGPAVARRLLVELTETVEIADTAGAAARITDLRALGVRVCLDDFGAGAAAFRYLREFQVDVVKIDGQYVRRAALGPRERSFVTAMVDLAATVGARVTAEQVETEEEAQLMRVLGVELGQGWLFGRPGPVPGHPR
jgi:EAL domain-containing protein (putative c-di-GMP-specific phosphodiesterase class I)